MPESRKTPMPESRKQTDKDSRLDGSRKQCGDQPSPRQRGKPILDVESERRDFGDGSDIHVW